jgi:alpha-galactosidase
VNVDDGWQGRRDGKGDIHPNGKFPEIDGLANYLHDNGLKFGIYTSPAPVTCEGYVGSHGYEQRDARTFANWGVDYLKYDWCDAGILYRFDSDGRAVYQKMGEALSAARRPIAYSLSGPEQTWGRKVGANLWRTGVDLGEGRRWEALSARFEADGNPDQNGPGGWNDPDMMLIGLAGMTTEENRTNMTLWSILAAPLILGNDVLHMTEEVTEILLNREVILVDQDPRGVQGRLAIKTGDDEVWVKPLADGSTAVALFNRGSKEGEIAVSWKDLGLEGPQQVRDLWRHLDLKENAYRYTCVVPAHGSVLLRVRRESTGVVR